LNIRIQAQAAAERGEKFVRPMWAASIEKWDGLGGGGGTRAELNRAASRAFIAALLKADSAHAAHNQVMPMYFPQCTHALHMMIGEWIS